MPLDAALKMLGDNY